MEDTNKMVLLVNDHDLIIEIIGNHMTERFAKEKSQGC